MKVVIRNERIQPVMYLITDRSVEVKTTSLIAAPDTIPPLSDLSFHLQEGDVILLTPEGGIAVKRGENNG